MVKRWTPRERSVGALESSHTHIHRAMWAVGACGVSNTRQSHHIPVTDPIVAPNSGAVVHFQWASWPCALDCGQPEHNYGTTTGWVRVVMT